MASHPTKVTKVLKKILKILNVCQSWKRHGRELFQETWMGLLLVQRLCACGVTRHRRNFCARRSEAVNPKSFVFHSYFIHISILF